MLDTVRRRFTHAQIPGVSRISSPGGTAASPSWFTPVLALLGAVALLAPHTALAHTTVHAWGLYYDGNAYVPMYVPAGLSNVVSLASGSDHIVALRSDGTVVAWGSCYFPWGFLPPMVPAGLSNVVALAAGEGQSLALRSDGTVVAWDALNVQAVPAEATKVVAIAAGGYGYGTEHNLAVRADGSVVAWGFNFSGQSTVPDGLTNAISVAAGAYHSLALRADGSVVAWGNGDYGQTNVPAGLANVVEAAAGKVFANLAVKGDGSVVPWGQYYDGYFYEPMYVPGGLGGVVSASVGNYHGMALRVDGSVEAWGYYHNGSSWLPITVPPGVSNVVAISSGGNHAAAVSGPLAPFLNTPLLDQTAVVGTSPAFRVRITATRPFSWQWRRNGQDLPSETNDLLVLTNVIVAQAGSYSVLVSNTVGFVESPTAQLTVVPLVIATQPQDRSAIIGGPASFTVACQSVLPLTYQWRHEGLDLPGENQSTLELTAVTAAQAGKYSVVISNSAGIVISSDAILATVPLAINSHPATQAIVIGDPATLAVDCQTYLPLTYQWRLNGVDLPGATANPLVLSNVSWGQQGRYSVTVSNSAGDVTSSNALLRLSTLATTITSWGLSNSLTIVPAGFTNAAAVAAGPNHNLVLWSDGTMAAWGQNDYGQATVAAEATNILAIAAGGNHSLALRSDGTVVAWGRNDFGQATVPAALSHVISIAAGTNHSLALRAEGTVAAWGANGAGQLNVPAWLSNVVAIAAGTDHSLALQANGTVVAWGANDYGQTNVPAQLGDAVAVAGGFGHTLALNAGGVITAWGSVYAGRTRLPATVPSGLTNALAVACGADHSLAIRPDGTVIAWGWNGNGQTNVPSGVSNVLAVAASDAHSLALVGTGSRRMKLIATHPAFGSNGFSLQMPTTCGRVYRLEYKSALEQVNWVALPLVPGIGAPWTFEDPTAGPGHRFYRVRQW